MRIDNTIALVTGANRGIGAALVEALLEQGASILFNNAGVLDVGSVLDTPSTAFDRNFDVNVFGLLHTSRAFASALTNDKALERQFAAM